MNIQRATIVRCVFCSLTLVCCLTCAQAAICSDTTGQAKTPNIVLIITDQQHAGMMSCTGNRYLKTPALDELAARGVRFERAYCGNPVCVPSRFGMMTGVLPSRIGMESNGQADVPDTILSHAMGNVFRRHGYETTYGGKVHLPGDRKKGITAYGFEVLTTDEREQLADVCAGYLNQRHDKPFLLVASFINPHDICYMAIDAFTQATSRPTMYPQSVRERECLAEDLQLPAGMTREKFFEDVCPPLPANFEIPAHEPSAARGEPGRGFRGYVQENWTEEDWRLHRWAYARLTERVDRHIGKVLAALKSSGLEDNTLVIFTSDHGDLDSAHRLEHKGMPYEEATRVPLIVSQPGVTPAGHVDDKHLVSNTLDLIPTMCDMAGVPIPEELKGRSLKSLLASRQNTVDWRDTLVIENRQCRVVVSQQHKYAVYDHGQPREMLVDLLQDPGEMRNLAVEAEFNDQLMRHRQLLKQWYTDYGQDLEARFLISP